MKKNLTSGVLYPNLKREQEIAQINLYKKLTTKAILNQEEDTVCSYVNGLYTGIIQSSKVIQQVERIFIKKLSATLPKNCVILEAKKQEGCSPSNIHNYFSCKGTEYDSLRPFPVIVIGLRGKYQYLALFDCQKGMVTLNKTLHTWQSKNKKKDTPVRKSRSFQLLEHITFPVKTIKSNQGHLKEISFKKGVPNETIVVEFRATTNKALIFTIIGYEENTDIVITKELDPRTGDSIELTIIKSYEDGLTPSIEAIIDNNLEKLNQQSIQKDFADFAPIKISTSVPKNTLFMKAAFDSHVKAPEETNLTIDIELSSKGINIQFKPYLFIDTWAGPFNGKLESIFFSFKDGSVNVSTSGSWSKKIIKNIQEQISNLIKNTLLDKKIKKNIFPYNPFQDNTLRQNLVIFQKQLTNEFSKNSEARNSSKEDSTNSIPLEQLNLSSGLKFKKTYSYDFGAGQAQIKKGSELNANLKLQGDLNKIIQNPSLAKIDNLSIETDGIEIIMKDEVQITIKKVSLSYGGIFSFDEMIISNKVVKGIRLAEALFKAALILKTITTSKNATIAIPKGNDISLESIEKESIIIDGIALPMIERQIEKIILKNIQESLQEMLESYGIDINNALGL